MAIIFREKMGSMIITQRQKNEKGEFVNVDFDVSIWAGNCLAVFNTEDEKSYYLYQFFLDEKHCDAIAESNKGKLFWDDVKEIKLNTHYDLAKRLARVFDKYEYSYTTFVEKPKK